MPTVDCLLASPYPRVVHHLRALLQRRPAAEAAVHADRALDTVFTYDLTHPVFIDIAALLLG